MDLSKRTRGLICLALALVTVGVYWQVGGFGFVNFDDPDYVTDNPMVKGGLSIRGVIWAFTHFYAGNWHPLTWISHMLDCEIFGLHAGGPHWVNVALHGANGILLFLLLQQLTGAQWRSALVAGLFLLHPLHVESVAWISERKDVLSTFFGLLSLLAYARYVKETKARKPKPKVWYACAIGLFILSLLSKPMLVTLPFVMLLLDFWPLQRVENAGSQTFFTKPFGKLIVEKMPWFVLAAASSVATLYAQKTGGAVAMIGNVPFLWRVFNGVEAYCWYLGKFFWPMNLAAFYPAEYQRPLLPFIGAAIVLVFISAVALRMSKRCPYFLMGWLWFLGTLVPVIGLVQVGAQGMADRYSYFPLIGIFVAFIWSGYEMVSGSKGRVIVAGCTAAGALAPLAVATVSQVAYWKNGITLFSHAVAVTRDNDTAFNNLGVALYKAGRNAAALEAYRSALRINPNAADVHKNISLVLAKSGNTEEALSQYEEAVRLDPASAEMQNFLGTTLAAQGRNEEALARQEEAVRLKPGNAAYQNDLGAVLAAVGKKTDALGHYAQAARLEPSNALYQNNLATALARSGDYDAAIEHYRAAVKDDPKFAEGYSNLGTLLIFRGRFDEAASEYSNALQMDPTNAAIRFNAGVAFAKMGRMDDAKTQFAQATSLRPDWVAPLNAKAWVLATSERDPLRDGLEAVPLAEKAAELTSRQQPEVLNTLAAAYAQVGRFSKAVDTANEAIALAQRNGQTNLAASIQVALKFYQTSQPFRPSGSGGN